MQTDTLIIGGGLSGLALAARLEAAGHDYFLVEARDRLGGRIKSLAAHGQAFDLGPSWIWPGQHRIFPLLKSLNLTAFAQWTEGDQIFQQQDGQVVRATGFMSMAGSYRIAGGTTALTDALAATLPHQRYLTGVPVLSVTKGAVTTLASGEAIHANQIVLALPPRLAADLDYQPALPKNAIKALNAIPTWMGAHAKFVAVYASPFWRKNGLSGDASSRRGPMVEIHDASPANGPLGALFGFVGVPSDGRQSAGENAIVQACLAQLEQLFGPEAGYALEVRLEDWSVAAFTSTSADATAPAGHPHYDKPAALEGLWDGQLDFAVTELAPDNGGLIEGALAAAEVAAASILDG